jgi:integrase
VAHDVRSVMSNAEITGCIVPRKGTRGTVLYAKVRVEGPGGQQKMIRLGKLWSKRSRVPLGYLTMDQAKARLELIKQGDDPHVNVSPSHITFERAIDEWLEYLEIEQARSKSHLRDCRNTARCHLKDAIGASTSVEDITRADIDALRSRLLREGKLARSTVRKIMVFLHGILEVSRKRGYIEHNPAKDAEKVSVRRSGDFQVLDPSQVALLVSKAENEQDAALYTVAAFSGLRLGELLGLRWRDVDFAKRILHVRRNHVLGDDKEPKSHKVRSVPLMDDAYRRLDDLSEREHFTDDADRVFVNHVGDVLGQDLLRRRFWKALEAAGLPKMRLHDLRHTFGTLAVQAFPLSDVQAFMGHADIATTMIYVHHVPQHDAADKLTALVHRTMHPTAEFSTEIQPTQAS